MKKQKTSETQVSGVNKCKWKKQDQIRWTLRYVFNKIKKKYCSIMKKHIYTVVVLHEVIKFLLSKQNNIIFWWSNRPNYCVFQLDHSNK